MILEAFFTFAVCALAYILFNALGNKHIAQLIVLLGVLLIASSLIKGCTPYVKSFNEKMTKVENIIDAPNKAGEKIDQTIEQLPDRLKERGQYKADKNGKVVR